MPDQMRHESSPGYRQFRYESVPRVAGLGSHRPTRPGAGADCVAGCGERDPAKFCGTGPAGSTLGTGRVQRAGQTADVLPCCGISCARPSGGHRSGLCNFRRSFGGRGRGFWAAPGIRPGSTAVVPDLTAPDAAKPRLSRSIVMASRYPRRGFHQSSQSLVVWAANRRTNPSPSATETLIACSRPY